MDAYDRPAQTPLRAVKPELRRTPKRAKNGTRGIRWGLRSMARRNRRKNKRTRRRPDAVLKQRSRWRRCGTRRPSWARMYQLQPNQIYDLRQENAAARWRGCSFLRQDPQAGSWEAEVSELYAKISQLRVERDFCHEGPGDEPGRACGNDRFVYRSVDAVAKCAYRTGALRGLSRRIPKSWRGR